MNEIINTKTIKNTSEVLVALGGNHNVEAIKIKLKKADTAKIDIKHAQNGILTDLIYFGECEANNQKEIELKPQIPVSASHIVVFAKNAEDIIDEVCVYEQEAREMTDFYPAYTDLNLSCNYFLDKVSVFMPSQGYYHYSIYTSVNDRDFKLLAKKTNNEKSNPDTGDVYDASGREARIIRVLVEYNSEAVSAKVKEISFEGKKSNTPIEECPKIDIKTFEESKYNKKITNDDTYNEVYGIIKRRLGEEYCSWFEFLIAPNPRENHTCDYFELSGKDNKIQVTANNGVGLAVGLNHYLKYFCKVNISQVGDQTNMPKEIVHLKENVFKETKAKVRYAYNYCTLSYSMAFWGEDEWRNEIDWLALNGVNAVLDAIAQEEVWRRFLTKLGYTHKEIKKYIAGPAYYAWAYMANLFGYAGPVHDSWFEKRTELARKNQYIMRKLGMQPILQGYSGMVPTDIKAHDKMAQIIEQGTWCSFLRPYMLKTTSPTFKEYACKFYEAQKEVYGNYSRYFATDPFHEGGNTAGMSLCDISKEVLEQMLKANKDAVWIIQSWQNNPSSELLAGIEKVKNGKEHALILDLYAEKNPNYAKGGEGKEAFGYKSEFNETPWIFCMLNNFGGRLGLHGHLDNLQSQIPKAFNECNMIAGIGITPEASANNPILYEFLFECIWQDNADDKLTQIDIDDYLKEYTHRRYGKESRTANEAWNILKNTVYKAELNNIGQGAPESVVNARPSCKVEAASTWGNAVISYDKAEFEKAARLMLEDYDKLKQSKGYIYDLVTIVQQVLSNRAQEYYFEMIKCFNEKDICGFEKSSEEFLKTADDMESVLSCSKYYLLGTWVNQAKTLAENTDDFTKRLYEFNAKSLITTWGAYNQAQTGQLHDYSNRQWSGLVCDFYKPRWERFISNCIAEMKNEPYEKDINWFEWEWNWAWQDTLYPTEAKKIDADDIKNRLKIKN